MFQVCRACRKNQCVPSERLAKQAKQGKQQASDARQASKQGKRARQGKGKQASDILHASCLWLFLAVSCASACVSSTTSQYQQQCEDGRKQSLWVGWKWVGWRWVVAGAPCHFIPKPLDETSPRILPLSHNN